MATFENERPVGKRLDFYAQQEVEKMQAYLICAKTARKFVQMFTEDEYNVRRIAHSSSPKTFKEFKERVLRRVNILQLSKVHHLHDLIEQGRKTEAIDYFYKSTRAWITNQPDSEIALKSSRRRRG